MQNKTLGEKTAEELVRLIREGEFKPGEKLPNEYDLSHMLGVGRNTVREALRGLSHRNIIDIRQGAGTFVSPRRGVVDDPLGFSLIDDQPRLVKDLLEVRCIIEPKLAALAAQNATAADMEKLLQLCRQVEEKITRREAFYLQDQDFHTQIAHCSHNTVMSRIIPVIGAGVSMFSSTVTRQEYEQTVKSHRQIYEAIRERRAADAQQAMLFHLLYNQNRFMEEQRF